MEFLNPTTAPKSCLPRTHFLKAPLLHCPFKLTTFSPHTCQIHRRSFRQPPLSLAVTTTCGLKTPQDSKKSKNKSNNITKQIILSEGGPPPLVEKSGDAAGGEEAPVKSGGGTGVMGLVKRLPRRVLSVLSYLALAIGEMFAIAGLMALGTFIDQGEAPDFYFDKYPESNPVLGMTTCSLPPFSFHYWLSSVHRYWPALTLGILEGAGLAGRFAPIGVHLAMLLIMVGGTLSASGSFKGTVMVPQGLNFVIGDVMRPIGFLSTAAESFNTEVHVNKFYMNYYDSGLDLKTDPGVPVVYAGFGALMLTTCISFLSHSQIWALQDGTAVIVGGKTNRAKGEFPEEMNRLLDRVPELVNSSLSRQSDSTVS